MSNLRYTLLVYDEDDDNVLHFFDNNFDARFASVRETIHFEHFEMLKKFVAQKEQSNIEQGMVFQCSTFPLNIDMADEKLPVGSLVMPVRPVPFLGHRPPSEVRTIDLEEEQEREVINISTKQLDKEKKPELIEAETSDDFSDVLNGSPEQVHPPDAEINGNLQKLSNDFEEIVQRPASDVPTTSLEDEKEQEKMRLFKLKPIAEKVNFPLIEMTDMTLDINPSAEDPQTLKTGLDAAPAISDSSVNQALRRSTRVQKSFSGKRNLQNRPANLPKRELKKHKKVQEYLKELKIPLARNHLPELSDTQKEKVKKLIKETVANGQNIKDDKIDSYLQKAVNSALVNEYYGTNGTRKKLQR